MLAGTTTQSSSLSRAAEKAVTSLNSSVRSRSSFPRMPMLKLLTWIFPLVLASTLTTTIRTSLHFLNTNSTGTTHQWSTLKSSKRYLHMRMSKSKSLIQLISRSLLMTSSLTRFPNSLPHELKKLKPRSLSKLTALPALCLVKPQLTPLHSLRLTASRPMKSSLSLIGGGST